MNKINLLLIVFLNLIWMNSFSQSGEGVIFLNNGKTKNVYIKNIFRYQSNNKAFDSIVRIELNDKKSSELIVYEYIKLEKKKKRFFARIIYEGYKSSLYSRYILHNEEAVYFPVRPASTRNPRADIYYAKKKNEEHCHEISLEGGNAIYGNKFKKKASKFFSDCPALVEKIKNKEINNTDKLEAFKYYDNKCE